MDFFWVVDMEVLEYVVFWDVGLWVMFVVVIYVGEFDWVLNEEYREIIEYEVLYVFFGVEFGGLFMDIVNSISRVFFFIDGREV